MELLLAFNTLLFLITLYVLSKVEDKAFKFEKVLWNIPYVIEHIQYLKRKISENNYTTVADFREEFMRQYEIITTWLEADEPIYPVYIRKYLCLDHQEKTRTDSKS